MLPQVTIKDYRSIEGVPPCNLSRLKNIQCHQTWYCGTCGGATESRAGEDKDKILNLLNELGCDDASVSDMVTTW